MKICVLGNSQTASLKNCWSDLSSYYPDVELTFFSSRLDGLKNFRLVNRFLIPQNDNLLKSILFTSGGLDRVDIDAFDCFLLYGLQISVLSLDNRHSVSLKRQTYIDYLSKSLSIKLCKDIISVKDVPVYLGCNPQKAEAPQKILPRVNELNYFESFDLLKSNLDIKQAVVVPQPKETLLNEWYTEHGFSIGSTRLDIGDDMSGQLHPDHDLWHMNSKFGKLWLVNFFRLLKKF